MIQKAIRWVLYSSLVVTLASCAPPQFGFDYYEQAHFYANGSGTFEIKIRLHKSKQYLALAQYLEKEAFTNMMITGAFGDMRQQLAAVPGISETEAACDKAKLTFRLVFHFRNVHTLNRAMRKIHAGLVEEDFTYFAFKKGAFIRHDPKPITMLLKQFTAKDLALVKSFDLPLFFKDMKREAVYHFDKKIKRLSNRCARLSANRQTIRMSSDIPCRKKEVTFNTIAYF